MTDHLVLRVPLIFAVMISFPVLAEQSSSFKQEFWYVYVKEYSDVEDKSQSAFECAALAEDFGNLDEFRRLKQIGYKEG